MFSYDEQINKAQHRGLLQIVQVAIAEKLVATWQLIKFGLRKGSDDILFITQASSRKHS